MSQEYLQPHAMLQGPWRLHSSEMRYSIVAQCKTIFFFDHSIAVKDDNEQWSVAEPGALGEATAFVESTRRHLFCS
jgi:hypothetical protein